MKEIIKNKLYTFENILPDQDCDYMIKQIKKDMQKHPYRMKNRGYHQNIIQNKEVTEKYKNIVEKLPVKDLSMTPILFLTYYPINQELSMHRDNVRYREKYKLLIYLNTVPKGGETLFYDDEGNTILSVPSIKGNGVLFDLNLNHSSNKILEGDKYATGFRLE